MRYWSYFVAKMVAAGAVLFGLLVLMNYTLPHGKVFHVTAGEKDYGKLVAPLENSGVDLLANVALMVWFVLAGVALYFIIRDQRYRCRVCLRKLRMPIETGSWSQMLQLGRPRTEYICLYGHGTLRADEVQISGLEAPEWTPQTGGIWDELCGSIIKDDKK